MTVKKLTVEHLRAMVRESVARQLKEKQAAKKAPVKESKTVKVTVGQLRQMVKEAVKSRLQENEQGTHGEGDLVMFTHPITGAKTHGRVDEVNPDTGMVAVKLDALRVVLLPVDKVEFMADMDDIDGMNPDDVADINPEYKNFDPGEDPKAELDRREQQLGNKLISKQSRKYLGGRVGDLKQRLGLPDEE
jgi:Zn finger protein HypA/HybF involved in hydrogenase expression